MSSPITDSTQIVARNNIRVFGNPDGRPIIFAHGFGCNQEVWREVAPHFFDDYRVILFDHVGAGESDLAAYDPGKYDSIDGYATDVIEILEQLDLDDAVYVGHSVSAMVGVVASVRSPSRFGALVLVGPSPRYVNDGDYVGGFEPADIEMLLDTLDSNYLGWSSAMGPTIMGNPDRPELGSELTQIFCRIEPAIASQFARVTFLSDNRSDLQAVTVPTLVLQSTDDVIAPAVVGEYVHANIPGSTLTVLSSTGHIPNLSGPAELTAAIRAWLE
jgi:sigma-B regulation protein RsbQ